MGRFRQRGQILNEDEEEDENVLRQRGEERRGQRRGEPRERESNAPRPVSERASGERPTSSERYQRASDERAAAAAPWNGWLCWSDLGLLQRTPTIYPSVS